MPSTSSPPRPRTPYAGRHVAARRRHLSRLPSARHRLGPTALTGLLASATVLTVAPAAAHALEAPAAAPQVAASSLPAPVTPYRVLPGERLRVRPPSYVLPVRGYHLTARFGMSSGLWAHTHTGLDFAAPEGTDIRAIAAGTVISTAYDGAYGNRTEVRLPDGTVLWYCHQSAVEVRPGERVGTGELIGHVGSTGNVTGPHLHLEVRPHGGAPVDPQTWLPTKGLHP